MKEIKEKLSEKYLKMEDHFNISFEVFKKLISENKLVITIYFLALTLVIIKEKYINKCLFYLKFFF